MMIEVMGRELCDIAPYCEPSCEEVEADDLSRSHDMLLIQDRRGCLRNNSLTRDPRTAEPFHD
jgi:hypothetical protein